MLEVWYVVLAVGTWIAIALFANNIGNGKKEKTEDEADTETRRSIPDSTSAPESELRRRKPAAFSEDEKMKFSATKKVVDKIKEIQIQVDELTDDEVMKGYAKVLARQLSEYRNQLNKIRADGIEEHEIDEMSSGLEIFNNLATKVATRMKDAYEKQQQEQLSQK
eukprot:TRINITY_DN19760_c0_g1_i1.p1 TRINITY_DN19760_c0_g1~~TRINITY_DN19760_c0_g1_i1.p1  ORF type:complete len:165 (-),score=44.26 TRINITY_DN19760_c0_g1_i1:53-547(-)